MTADHLGPAAVNRIASLNRDRPTERDRGSCHADPRNWCRYNSDCRACLGTAR